MELKFPEVEDQKKSPEVVAREREMPSSEPEAVGGPLVLLKKLLDINNAKKRLDQYIKVVEDMFTQAKAIIINNDATNVDATALGTSAMTLYKKIIAAKDQVPYYTEAKDYINAVEAIADMLIDKLYSTNKKKETVVSITKEKISQYAVVQEALRREQEALEKKAREDLQKQLDEKAKATGIEAPKVEEPLIKSRRETTVRTETGSSYGTHRWDFEVLDKDVPQRLLVQLLSLSLGVTPEDREGLLEVAKELKAIIPYVVILYEDTRIRKAIKDGLRNIHPSIHIFEKIDTRFKTGK
jgi:hypothetical protein